MNSVEKALWYVESHLAEPIRLEDVAAVAGVSSHHLVRAFGAAFGRSVMRYVRGRRLSEAAKALAGGAPSILAIALDAGYGSHEAFTRAFHDELGISPQAVRARRNLDGLALVAPILMNECPRSDLEPPRCAHGGTLFSALPAELSRIRIAARKYVVFTHRGHVHTVRGTWTSIWARWLPESGHTLADAPISNATMRASIREPGWAGSRSGSHWHRDRLAGAAAVQCGQDGLSGRKARQCLHCTMLALP